MVGSS